MRGARTCDCTSLAARRAACRSTFGISSNGFAVLNSTAAHLSGLPLASVCTARTVQVRFHVVLSPGEAENVWSCRPPTHRRFARPLVLCSLFHPHDNPPPAPPLPPPPPSPLHCHQLRHIYGPNPGASEKDEYRPNAWHEVQGRRSIVWALAWWGFSCLDLDTPF